jgi:hypothetical protein
MKTYMSIALILAAFASVTVGQEELDRLDEKIKSHLEAKFPGWRYKRVEAFQPSSTVLVQGWSSGNWVVQMAVAVRKTPEDANKELHSFLEFKPERQELTGFGDEAFASGIYHSQIVLRKGRYVIYLSIVDTEGRTLSGEEAELRKSEMQRIPREFARHLSTLDFPN